MTEDAELVTKTPLQLHPEVLSTLGADHQSDPVVGNMRDALSTARASWHATLTGHKKILADVTNTEMANLQRSAKAADRRQTEALQRLDQAVERGRREIAMITEGVNRTPDPPAPHVSRMVAEALRSMDAKDRGNAIAEALKAGDHATLGAVLFVGPPFAYGLSRTERDVFLHQYQHATYPDAMKRRAALERGIDLLMKAGPSLLEAHAKLFPRDKLDQAAALAREAEAALGD